MPIRHRRHLTRPEAPRRCPKDLESKLRNPQCRREMAEAKTPSQPGYDPGHKKPKPKPPTPHPHPHPPTPHPHPHPHPPTPHPHPHPPPVPPINPPVPPITPPSNGGPTIGQDIGAGLGAALTGYGVYRARNAYRKIANNRRAGRDWRGRETPRSDPEGRGTEMREYRRVPAGPEEEGDDPAGEARGGRVPTDDADDFDRSQGGTRRTNVRRLSAREMDERNNRPLRTQSLDNTDPDRTDEFRQARPAEERPSFRNSLRSRASNLRDNLRMRATRPRGAYEPVEEEGGETEMTEFGNEEFDEARFGEQGATEAVEDSAEDAGESAEDAARSFRPVDISSDPENPAVRQLWSRNFMSKMKNIFQRPPPEDPDQAGTELRSAQTAEREAQASTDAAESAETTAESGVESAESGVSDAKDALQGIDEAFQASKAQQAKLTSEESAEQEDISNETTEGQAAEESAIDEADPEFDETLEDADVEAEIVGDEATGLDDTGNLEGDLAGEEADVSADAGADAGDGIEMADLGEGAVEAGAEGGAEAGGEALGLVADAGIAEVAGGGPEDPIGDIVAGGLAIAGGAVALGQWISGMLKKPQGPPSYYGVQNASQMTGPQYLSFVTNIESSAAKAKTQAEKTAYKNYLTSVQNAWNTGRPIVTYKNETTGKQAIAMQLTKKQIADAIQAYETNPNVYKGWSKAKLQIMGLNPHMSEGKAGATQTPKGTWVPTYAYDNLQKSGVNTKWTSGAGGGNWSNFYLSESFQKTQGESTFATLDSIADLGSTAAEKKAVAQANYISQVNANIAQYAGKTGWKGAMAKYLTWKLNKWKYQQGLTTTNPGTAPPIPVGAAAQSAIAADQSILAGYQNQLASIQSTLTTDKSKQATDQQAVTAAQQALTQAQANQTSTSATLKQDQTNLQNAQNLVTQQQAQVAKAQQQATTYNQNLASNLHQQYITQYHHALDVARLTNTAVDTSTLINPSALYNQYKVSGTTGITAPTRSLTGSGVSFQNGQPIFTKPTTTTTSTTQVAPNSATTGVVNNKTPST